MTTKTHNTLGPVGRARGFFEADEEFQGPPEMIEPLIDAYEAAAQYAMLTARFALKNPEQRDQALWAEASASTIGWVLYRYAAHNPPDGLDDIQPWRMMR